MSYKLRNFAIYNNIKVYKISQHQLCMSYKLRNFAIYNNRNLLKPWLVLVVYVLQIKKLCYIQQRTAMNAGNKRRCVCPTN